MAACWASHSDAGLRMPALSPGKRSAVLVPRPKSRSALSRPAEPSLRAIWIVPRLLDTASTPAAVRCSTPCGSASVKVRPAIRMFGGTVTGVSAEIRPRSIAAAMVMTLLTLPGSYTSWVARFFRVPGSAVPTLLGS